MVIRLLFSFILCVCSCFHGSFAINTTPLRDSLAVVYRSQIGVREATGHNDGVMVETYQRATGNKPGDAWCASFVFWCLKQIGIKPKANAAAASFFKPDKVVWKRDVDGIKSFEKKASWRGNTGSLYFANLGRIAHIFFIDDVRGDYIITVEGNTNNGLSREGDGVYLQRRRIRNIYSVSNHIDEIR